jgi:hypothetical protein
MHRLHQTSAVPPLVVRAISIAADGREGHTDIVDSQDPTSYVR